MSRSAARSVVGYNLGRLGLFVVCVVLGYLAGLRSIWLLVAALLVSGVLSYFLLARQRVAMAVAMTDAVGRSRARIARRTADEDAYVDTVLAEQGRLTPPAQDSDHVTRPDR